MVLSVSPFKIIPPSTAVKSVGVPTTPSSIDLSSTKTVDTFIVTVFPLTKKSPKTAKLPLTYPSFVIITLCAAVNVILPAFDTKLIEVALFPCSDCINILSSVPPFV